MKPPVECVSHALAGVWWFSTMAAASIHVVAPEFVSDERMLSVALFTGALSGVIVWCASKGGMRERLATALSSIGFAVALGPFVSVLLVANNNIPAAAQTSVIAGASFLAALLGWPFYKLILALFVASGEHASGLGEFFGTFFKTLMRKKGE